MNELPLRDIHLPDAISWWPLAFGWWLLPLLIILCALGIYLFLKIKKQKAKMAYRKFALNELNKIKSEFKNQQNSLELIRAISALLRRIALSYLPRETIASLTGEPWVKQLNQLGSEQVFNNEFALLLEKAPYMKHADFDASEILSLCEQWIKSLPSTRNFAEVQR